MGKMRDVRNFFATANDAAGAVLKYFNAPDSRRQKEAANGPDAHPSNSVSVPTVRVDDLVSFDDQPSPSPSSFPTDDLGLEDLITFDNQPTTDHGLEDLITFDQPSPSPPSSAKIFNNAAQHKVHDISGMVVSLSDQEQAITSRLTRGSSQRYIIPIVGMAGIGKTTLAKKVYNDPKVVYHFHRRAWCSVSPVYGKRELLLDIIKDVHGLPDEIDQMTDADLELKLFQKLKRIRYLIVMDLWDIKAWNDLEMSFPDDGVGSRILITSRFLDVALLLGKPHGNPHMLRLLSDDESWNLLEMKSFPEDGGGCPDELVEIGKEIAHQCKGLPLAVVAVAGILRRTEHKHQLWEEIVESFSSKINADPETQCKVILELSYMHLPSHLKECFLYLGAFPENKQVPVSKLIRLWIAEGFIESNEATKSLEDIAEDFLMDLINGSLVMISRRRSNGRVKACSIHGLLRDLCLSKAQEENFLQQISKNDEPYASFDRYDYGSDFYDVYPSFDPVTYKCHRLCIYLKRKHFVYSNLLVHTQVL